MNTRWHALSVAEAEASLGVHAATGLGRDEAAGRLARQGPNLLREAPRRAWYALLLGQFRDFMILVLLAAAALAAVTGGVGDVVVILAIVLLNASIGFAQEYRAETAMHALRRMAAPQARARRDGRVEAVGAGTLVPGDVVLLEAGAIVPADLRLVEVAGLACQEAALTGESQPVAKQVDPLDADLPVAERRNMAFKGTLVASGRGVGLVVATAMETELGRIAGLLEAAPSEPTPLQRRLAGFGRRLSLLVIVVCALILVAGLLRGEPVVLMLLTAISLAVAAIPEALPAVVTIALALGARKMVRRRALVRHLPAVETLGSVTFACTDKTGTLTENHMRVRAWWVDGALLEAPPAQPAGTWLRLRDALAVSNDVEAGEGGALGDPTEVALVEAAAALGLDRPAAVARLPRIAERPFDSTRQRMATIHRDGDAAVAFVKGAPEAVLPLCGASPRALAVAAGEAAAGMAADGRRVLAIAVRELPVAVATPEAAESGLALLGLVGLEDPPRPEAAAAVRACREAGITPVMITGDHPATARSIAAELGLLPRDGRVLTGAELDTLDDAALGAAFDAPVAFARVTPGHKLRIVEALKGRGEFVAMTGDGVNDAPALKRADIGVAMGRGGTDVAREAADMVLLDDNFATLVGAVEEGRRIYDNVRKFVRYTMTSNSAEVLTLLLAPLLGMPLPLLPVHILWINLVTDGLPGLALTVEPAERGVMRRPPRPPLEGLFGRGLWQHVAVVGGLMGSLALLAQATSLGGGADSFQTLVFTLLVFAQLAHVLAIRSEHESLWRCGLLTNVPLLAVAAGSVLVQLAIVYTPAGNRWFDTVPLTAAELGMAVAAAGVVLLAVEAEKLLVRRGWLYGSAAPARQPGA